ncbi:MAG TPA: 50S ribosomal protein L17 [Patescibacteria group bacterium]|nr:50S ribosomal protein L17 [Patescibacteria group bacterium]
MIKKVFGKKLSRSRPAREALFATLARSIILNGKMETTKAKAKAVQSDLEKFVTVAKKGGLAGMRRVMASLDNQRDAVDALYKKVAPSFTTRTSGFTRIISLPRRKGDNAEMVRIEWTDKMIEVKKEVIKPKKHISKIKAVKGPAKTAPKVKTEKKEVKKLVKKVSKKGKKKSKK